jgi:hypothetical protein
MKRLLLTLAVLLVASPSYAATLYYYAATGQGEIDPTSKGAEAGGKVTGYNLVSNGRFFVDPARTSAFPPPSPTFFENTSNVIGDNDLTLQGTSALLNLRQLFITAPANQAELDAKFTGKIYVATPGTPEVVLPAVFIIPEPATAAMGGLCLLGLAFRRRLIG